MEYPGGAIRRFVSKQLVQGSSLSWGVTRYPYLSYTTPSAQAHFLVVVPYDSVTYSSLTMNEGTDTKVKLQGANIAALYI